MTEKQIRVGIVGASAQKSWAHLSHVPAINGLSGLKLAAVATRNEQSARKSAEAFGANRWFSDPLAMIRDDRIDLITISVKVPAHRELVLAALNAGKAVYCEAPLGRTVAEAEEMASAVGSLHTAIGPQGRLESSRRKTGVFTGRSTFEPLAINASQIFTAAPKYPKPIAVPADACAAPVPSNPKPFWPSPERDKAVFCVVMSATPLDGPISEAGARRRARVDVVALISPSLPTS